MPTVVAVFDDEASLTRAQDALAKAPFDTEVKQIINGRGDRTGTAFNSPGSVSSNALAGSNLPGGNLPGTGLPAGSTPGSVAVDQAGRTAPTGVYNTLSGYDIDEDEAAYVEQILSKGGSAVVIDTADVPGTVGILRQHGAQQVIESTK